MNGRYFNNELPLDSNNANDLGLTDQDPFGLRALGIFSDEAPTLETNSFHQHPATRNPFHFDWAGMETYSKNFFRMVENELRRFHCTHNILVLFEAVEIVFIQK